MSETEFSALIVCDKILEYCKIAIEKFDGISDNDLLKILLQFDNFFTHIKSKYSTMLSTMHSDESVFHDFIHKTYKHYSKLVSAVEFLPVYDNPFISTFEKNSNSIVDILLLINKTWIKTIENISNNNFEIDVINNYLEKIVEKIYQ